VPGNGIKNLLSMFNSDLSGLTEFLKETEIFLKPLVTRNRQASRPVKSAAGKANLPKPERGKRQGSKNYDSNLYDEGNVLGMRMNNKRPRDYTKTPWPPLLTKL
jgi:hypothetical protein